MAGGEGKRPGLWVRVQALVIALAVRLLLWTVRFRVLHAERLLRARELGRPILFAFWHGRQLGLFGANPEPRLAILASLSQDGDLQELICRRFGLTVVRGSSSRGALAGLRGLMGQLKRGVAVGLAVDGPRGPVFEAKPGIGLLAKRSGSPILPITVGYRRRWELGRAWDRFQIPVPFTRATVVYGEPLQVPADEPGAALACWGGKITESLRALTAEADGAGGR